MEQLVSAHVNALKARGAESAYLRQYVLGQINPLRGSRGKAEFDPTLDRLHAGAQAFDPAAVNLAALGG